MKKLLPLVALVAPLQLAAQTATTVSPYVSADDGVRGSPVLVGATVSREAGWLAFRVGAGMDPRFAPPRGPEAGETPVGVVSVDADGMLFFGNAAGDGPVIPYALAGVGTRVLDGASNASVGFFWSYGAGARTPVSEWLSMEGEARYRQPVGRGVISIPAEVSAGWEFRFGLNLRLTGAAASRRSVSTPSFPARSTSAPRAAPAGAAAARRAVAMRALDTADDYLGVRYTWGGNTPDEGFDCSGFTRFVFARHGVDLPRVSRDQARFGAPVPLEISAFEPGDLLAFASRPGGEVDHIAIYMGDGRIIHSSSSARGVKIDDLNSRRGAWYRNHMVAARRVIEAGMPWSFGEN